MSGFPCHACGLKIFNLVADSFGSFIRCDDQTTSWVRMDEARFLIKTSIKTSINEACVVVVDGESFRCFLKEDSTSIFLNSLVIIGRDNEGSNNSSSPAEFNSHGKRATRKV